MFFICSRYFCPLVLFLLFRLLEVRSCDEILEKELTDTYLQSVSNKIFTYKKTTSKKEVVYFATVRYENDTTEYEFAEITFKVRDNAISIDKALNNGYTDYIADDSKCQNCGEEMKPGQAHSCVCEVCLETVIGGQKHSDEEHIDCDNGHKKFKDSEYCHHCEAANSGEQGDGTN